MKEIGTNGLVGSFVLQFPKLMCDVWVRKLLEKVFLWYVFKC